MCTDGAGRRGHSSRGNSVDKGLERETLLSSLQLYGEAEEDEPEAGSAETVPWKSSEKRHHPYAYLLRHPSWAVS